MGDLVFTAEETGSGKVPLGRDDTGPRQKPGGDVGLLTRGPACLPTC